MNKKTFSSKVASVALSLAMVLSMASPLTALAEAPELSKAPVTQAATPEAAAGAQDSVVPEAQAVQQEEPTKAAAPQEVPVLYADGDDENSYDLTHYINSIALNKAEGSSWVPSDNKFKDGDDIQIVIKYTADKNVINSTDKKFVYNIPSQISLKDITKTGDVLNDGKTVGTYTIDPDKHTLSISYTADFVAKGESFEGTVELDCKVDGGGNQVDTTFKFPGLDTPEVTITPNAEKAWDIATSKSADTSAATKDGDKINYTINVTTTKGTEGTVTVADSLDSNAKQHLNYDTNSIVVTDATGATVSADKYTISWNADNSGFEITGLPKLENKVQSYHVSYSTTVKDGALSTPDGKPKNEDYIQIGGNNVTVKSGENSGNGNSSVTINNKTISKSGQQLSGENSDKIQWSIEVNCHDMDISGLKLSDVLPAGIGSNQVGDFKVYDLNNNSSDVTDAYGTDFSTMFTTGYTFTEATKGHYRITYTTPCEVPAFGAPDNNYKNTASLGDHETGATVGVKPGSRLNKTWTSDEAKDGLDGRVYTWTSTIKNVKSGDVYTDWLATDIDENGKPVTLDPYQSFTPETWALGGVNADDYALKYLTVDGSGNVVESDTLTAACKGFKLTFNKDIGDATITYKTAADYSDLATNATRTFQNIAQIKTGEVTEKKPATHTYTNKTNLSKKVWRGGGYNGEDLSSVIKYSDLENGTLKYRLVLNEAGTLTGDQTIVDTLPEGWTYVEGSFNCSASIWLAQPLPGVTCTANGRELTFNVSAEALAVVGKSQIYLDYSVKPKVDANGMEQAYTNTAKINGGDETSLTQKITRDPGKLLEKSSSYDATTMKGKTIPYTVIINPDESDLVPNQDTVTLKDTLSLPLDGILAINLQKDDIKLYAYNATAAGKKGALIPSNQYSYTFGTTTDSSKIYANFNITLADSKGYVLEYAYQPEVSSSHRGNITVSNSANLEGLASSGKDVQYALANSSATASKRSSLTIFKVDSGNYEMMLEGAVFELSKYNKDSGSFAAVNDSLGIPATGRHFVTSAEGKSADDILVDSNALYMLTEKAAPTGYQQATTPWYFALGAGGEPLSELQTAIAPALTALGITSDKVNYYTGAGVLDLPNTQKDGTLQLKKVWLNSDGSEMTAPANAEVQLGLWKTPKHAPATAKVTVQALDGNGGVKAQQAVDVKIATDNYVRICLDYTYGVGDVTVKQGATTLATLKPDSADKVFYTLNNIAADTTITFGDKWDTPVITLDYTKPILESGTAVHIDDYTLNAANHWTQTVKLPADDQPTDYYTIVEKSIKVGDADVTGNYTVSYSANNTTGIRTGILTATNQSNTEVKTGKLDLKKVDANSTSTVLKDAVFFLYTANIDGGKWTPGTTVGNKRATNGTCSFDGLSAGNYLLVETTAPQGYVLPSYRWQVTVTETGDTAVVKVPGTVDAVGTPTDKPITATAGVFPIGNSQTEPSTVDVSITKAWNDNGNKNNTRPGTDTDKVKMTLYANGIAVENAPAPTITANAGNTWTYAWSGLPKKTTAGGDITYTVKETETLDEYGITSDDTVGNGGTITNSYPAPQPVEVSISITKAWDDNGNKDKKRPETTNTDAIKMTLYADSVEKTDVPPTIHDNGNNTWTYTWNGLPKKTEAGGDITYTVKETTVPNLYANPSAATAVNNGDTITNTYPIPAFEKVSISITKKWVDNGNVYHTRPDTDTDKVKMTLYADGVAKTDVTPTITDNADGTWTYTWSGLDKQSSRTNISYTVKETTAPACYTPSTLDAVGDKGTITNTLAYGTLRITKVDSYDGSILPGAMFGVYTNAEATTAATVDTTPVTITSTTLATGTSVRLPIGTYYVKETTVPNGYILDTNIYPVTLTKDTTTVLANNNSSTTFGNTPTKVTISKVAVTGGSEIGGAVLRIEDESGHVVVPQWTSVANQKHVVTKLVPGNYVLVEVTAPAGYKKADPVSFTVPDNTEKTNVSMIDEACLGKAIITKRSFTADGDKLKGASYIFYYEKDGAKHYYKGTDDRACAIWTDTLAEASRLTTGDDGTAAATGLTKGDYFFREVTPPTGHMIDETPIKATITTGNSISNAVSASVDQVDQGTKVSISKVAIAGGPAIAGAQLKIVDENKNTVAEWTSEANKVYEINGKLNPGKKYTLVEVKAPFGYEPAKDIAFTVSTDGSVNKVEMVDTPSLGTATITKHSVSTDGEKLKGCSYVLYRENANTRQFYRAVANGCAVWTDKREDALMLTTGDDGTATATGLPKGKYFFLEVTPPAGHLIDETPIPVDITEKNATDPAVAEPVAQADPKAPTPTTTPTPSPTPTPTPTPAPPTTNHESDTSTPAPAVTPTPTPVTIPRTSDSSQPLLYVAAMVAAVLGFAGVYAAKRRKH